MVKEKECEACGVFFTPSRSNVKYCPDCSTHSDQVKRKIERQTQKNIERYGYGTAPKEIKNVCKQCGKIFISYVHPKDFCSYHCESAYHIEHTHCAYCERSMKDTETIFDTKGKIWFCSKECEEKRQWELARESGNVHICPNCKKEHIKKGKYCSKACYYEDVHKKKLANDARKQAGLKLCPVCGKEFAGDGSTCSAACEQKKKDSEPQVKRRCVVCGKFFNCPASKLTIPALTVCSDECRKTLFADRKEAKKGLSRQKEQKKEQEYINKNGLCSICKTSYVDCERMQSNFRCYPKGSSCKGNLVVKCPKYTR